MYVYTWMINMVFGWYIYHICTCVWQSDIIVFMYTYIHVMSCTIDEEHNKFHASFSRSK